MKITKQKEGYKIRLGDSEMELLSIMVAMAETDQPEVWDRCSVIARRAYSRRCGPRGRGWKLLRVDVDRRGNT